MRLSLTYVIDHAPIRLVNAAIEIASTLNEKAYLVDEQLVYDEVIDGHYYIKKSTIRPDTSSSCQAVVTSR